MPGLNYETAMNWGVGEVLEWLKSNSLDEFHSYIVSNKVDGPSLIQLDKNRISKIKEAPTKKRELLSKLLKEMEKEREKSQKENSNKLKGNVVGNVSNRPAFREPAPLPPTEPEEEYEEYEEDPNEWDDQDIYDNDEILQPPKRDSRKCFTPLEPPVDDTFYVTPDEVTISTPPGRPEITTRSVPLPPPLSTPPPIKTASASPLKSTDRTLVPVPPPEIEEEAGLYEREPNHPPPPIPTTPACKQSRLPPPHPPPHPHPSPHSQLVREQDFCYSAINANEHAFVSSSCPKNNSDYESALNASSSANLPKVRGAFPPPSPPMVEEKTQKHGQGSAPEIPPPRERRAAPPPPGQPPKTNYEEPQTVTIQRKQSPPPSVRKGQEVSRPSVPIPTQPSDVDDFPEEPPPPPPPTRSGPSGSRPPAPTPQESIEDESLYEATDNIPPAQERSAPVISGSRAPVPLPKTLEPEQCYEDPNEIEKKRPPPPSFRAPAPPSKESETVEMYEETNELTDENEMPTPGLQSTDQPQPLGKKLPVSSPPVFGRDTIRNAREKLRPRVDKNGNRLVQEHSKDGATDEFNKPKEAILKGPQKAQPPTPGNRLPKQSPQPPQHVQQQKDSNTPESPDPVRRNKERASPGAPPDTGAEASASTTILSHVSNPDDITTQSWYYCDVTRSEAISMLMKSKKDGDYLVRSSERSGQPYTLSFYFQGDVFNIPIRRRKDEKFALGTEKPDENVFQTVYDMIRFHSNNAIEVSKEHKCIGKVKLGAIASR